MGKLIKILSVIAVALALWVSVMNSQATSAEKSPSSRVDMRL